MAPRFALTDPTPFFRQSLYLSGDRYPMYVAMNRFKVRRGSEEDFEAVWKNRNSSLHEMQGFKSFHLLKGPVNEDEGYTLYASHTIWRSHDDFVAWTKSQNFR